MIYGSASPPSLSGGIAPPPLIQPQDPMLQQAQAPGTTFQDATAGINSIAQNFAAGFSKDPARRQAAAQQLQIQQAQRQQELQTLREHQLHVMDQMVNLAANGGATPATYKFMQNMADSADKLWGPGTGAQINQLFAAADASFKNQPKNTELVTAIDPKTGKPTYVPKEQAAGMQASTDVLSPEALAQKEALAKAGSTNVSIDARPVNQEQAKALGYADRMAQANDTIEGLNYQPTIAGNAVSSLPVVGNALTSEQHQQFNQAKLNFMSANLRKESGAVISAEEYKSQDEQYFPQPGDSEKTIEQKAKNRKQAILNTYREGRNVTGAEAGKTAEQGSSKANKPKVLKYDPATDSLSPVE
jgi:hypothetical protein